MILERSNRSILGTTNDTGEVVAMAVRLGKHIWQESYQYAKAGIMIAELGRSTIWVGSAGSKAAL